MIIMLRLPFAALIIALLTNNSNAADNDAVVVVGNSNSNNNRRRLFQSNRRNGARRTAEQRENMRQCVRWATGLEHESMLVHRTPDGREEYAVDANKILREMSRYGVIHGLTHEQHQLAVEAFDAGAEFSGRRCANSNDISYKAMMESVSQDARELTFDGAWDQIVLIDNTFIEMANKHPFIKKVIKDQGLGPVTRPNSGMSAELGMYQRTGGKWYRCSSCKTGDCRLKDYTGSYHMSISLPSTLDGWVARDDSILLDQDSCAVTKEESDVEEQPPSRLLRGLAATDKNEGHAETISEDRVLTTEETPEEEEEEMTPQRIEWINAHINLSNMIQWAEPLIVAVFGSSDSEAVCDAGRFTEGSFRTMNTGWGVPGTTDIHDFINAGVGRYVTERFEWMFPDNPEDAPFAYRENLAGCMESGMGADIRSKTTVDEHFLRPDDVIPPMEVGRGIEVRIFDNFPIKYMPQAYRFITMIAEAGRLYTAPVFIHDTNIWSETIQLVMKEGWNAILPDGYVKALVTALNLPSSFLERLGDNRQAYTVYETLYKTLWELHSKGMWTVLLLDEVPEELPPLDVPNRETWQHGAITMGYSPKAVADLLGFADVKSIKEIRISDIKIADEDLAHACNEDIEDFVYLAEHYGMLSEIKLATNGSIESFVVKGSDSWDGAKFTPLTCVP